MAKLNCRKCGWSWFPHVENPRKCPNPNCQTYKWKHGGQLKSPQTTPSDHAMHPNGGNVTEETIKLSKQLNP